MDDLRVVKEIVKVIRINEGKKCKIKMYIKK